MDEGVYPYGRLVLGRSRMDRPVVVFTDYLTERMLGPVGNVIRLVCQLGASLSLVGYVIWIIVIVWS